MKICVHCTTLNNSPGYRVRERSGKPERPLEYIRKYQNIIMPEQNSSHSDTTRLNNLRLALIKSTKKRLYAKLAHFLPISRALSAL